MRTFQPENRLAKLIKLPGGVSLAEAMMRANRNLNTVRETCLAGADEKVAAIEGVMTTETPERAALDQIYLLANDVFAEAGALGESDLSAAAHSLCELTSHDSAVLRSWEPVRVHVGTMRLLRSSQLDERQRRGLVEGVLQVSARASA